ncbi:response regulator [Lunatibacter salilacus]|uniref:response regulator n=1 Tax=Lunatibacter salilacus TaxID=2483804 RepID=UPI00131CB4DA|nr:response regulator [Lunatibacter salilacus]
MNHKPEKLKVILVDDMDDEHVVFKKALSSIEYIQLDLISFKTAEELEEYLARPLGNTTHILFLDLHLTNKGGLECLKKIRTNPSYKQLIVAIYSMESDERTIRKCLAEGANIFITKPSEYKLLQQRIQEALRSCMQFHTMGINFETFVRCF